MNIKSYLKKQIWNYQVSKIKLWLLPLDQMKKMEKAIHYFLSGYC